MFDVMKIQLTRETQVRGSNICRENARSARADRDAVLFECGPRDMRVFKLHLTLNSTQFLFILAHPV